MLIEALLLVVGAAVVFVAGAVSGHRKTFPFNQLLLAKHRLRALVRARTPAPDVSPTLRIAFDSAADLELRRRQLHDFIWAGCDRARALGALPLDSNRPVDPRLRRALGADVDVVSWHVEMEHGIDSVIVSLTPARCRPGTCVVYQQGHEGEVWHGRQVLRGLLKQGYRVVALAMPLLGPNCQPTVDLRRHGPVRLQEHDAFALLDAETGRSSIRFFVEPVLACLNRLQNEGYTRIAMLGSSGGGWTTTLCAALDPRITLSFPTAGSLPLDLRDRGELSDYENYLPPLYNVANYPELYVMAASGAGRASIQILNEYDTVIWPGRRALSYAAAVQQKVRSLGDGTFDVVIDGTWIGHGISRWALNMILQHIAPGPSEPHRPDVLHAH